MRTTVRTGLVVGVLIGGLLLAATQSAVARQPPCIAGLGGTLCAVDAAGCHAFVFSSYWGYRAAGADCDVNGPHGPCNVAVEADSSGNAGTTNDCL